MPMTQVLETKRAKLMVALVALVLLAVFQVALQAKPAHAWEVNLSARGAGQITEVTDAGLIARDCVGGLNSPDNTPTGQIGDSCSPGTPSGTYSHGWIVEYRATAKPGYQFVRWQNDRGNEPNTYGPVLCDGWNGINGNNNSTNPTYTGQNCRFQIGSNLQVQAVFEDASSPSQPSITSTTPAVTNQAVSFTFPTPSDPTFRRFECKVTPTVQPDFQECTSGISFNPTDGTYSFEVRAVDWSGNASSPANRSWTVDKTPPFPSINSGPFGTVNSSSATFTFSSTDSTASFQCSLDGGAFSSCTSSNSQSYAGLLDGSHAFRVKATDAVGNSSTTSNFWTIDTVLPETTLDPNVGPADESTTQENDPVFQFSSNETNTTFECNLTGPGLTNTAYSLCNPAVPGAGTKSYTNLKDGTYTFKVRSKDRATNVDASPAERTWTINNTPAVLASSLTPAKAATGVSRTTDVSASFSEEMAPTSIANLTTHVSRTFKLQMYNAKKRKWIAVPAAVDVTNSNTTAILDPYGATEGPTEKALAARKKFRATITTGVTDAQGNPIARNFVWTFTTGST